MFEIFNEEIAEVSGGKIMCTISNRGVSCTGSASEWGSVLFSAFDQLQTWGGELGCAIYDWTH